MNLFKAMEVSASGLRSQRLVIDSVSLNLANIQTTRTEEGGPYRRRRVVFSAPPQTQNFLEIFENRLGGMGNLRRTHPNHFPVLPLRLIRREEEWERVRAETVVSPEEYQIVFDPSHPDADEFGYLRLPNINLVEEMVTLLKALRNFEANVTAFNAAKDMFLKALEIGR